MPYEPSALDEYEVEAYGHVVIFSIAREENLSRFYYSPYLPRVEGKLQIRETEGGPRFDFYEDQGIPVHGDDVDFAPSGTEITDDHAEPRLGQAPRRDFLPFPAERGAVHVVPA